MKKKSDIVLRNLQENDIEIIAATFNAPWTTIEANTEKWKQYYKEQQQHIRTVCVLQTENQFIGYGSLLRISEYPHFKNAHIPEINDVWIGSDHRRKGFGKMLLSHLEDLARQEGYSRIGIGVGLYQDYGPAQNLYFRQGYAPDTMGITYKCAAVIPGQSYPVDDELLIWLTKSL